MTSQGAAASGNHPAISDVLVARQRSCAPTRLLSGTNSCTGPRPSRTGQPRILGAATGHVLAAAMFSVGLERLVGAVPAWINRPQSSLIDDIIGVLPADQVVIEILRSVEPNPGVVETCTLLKQRGFTFAIDDFRPDDPRQRLLGLADYAKADTTSVDAAAWAGLTADIRSEGAAPIAYRVEGWFELQRASRSGFDLFQGSYLTKPQTVSGHEVPVLDSTRVMALKGPATAYESGRWDRAEMLSTAIGITQAVTTHEYVEAVDWARSALSA